MSNTAIGELWGRLTERLLDENICERAIMMLSVSVHRGMESRRTVDGLGSGGEGGVQMWYEWVQEVI